MTQLLALIHELAGPLASIATLIGQALICKRLKQSGKI